MTNLINSARPIFIALSVMLSVSFAWSVQAEEMITLEQAIQIATEKSPSLSASKQSLIAVRAAEGQAKSAYLPQVSASASISHTSTYIASGSYGSTSPSANSFSTGVSVSQYIYDFGKTDARVERSSQSVVLAQNNYETAENTLTRDVKQAYYEVLKKQQLVSVGEENLKVQRQQLDQSKALYEQGLRPRSDITRVEVAVSKAMLTLTSRQMDLKSAVIAFESLLGGSPFSGEYSLAEPGDIDSGLPELDQLIALAFDKRPELAGFQAQAAMSAASLKAVEKNAYPSFNATGSLTLYDDELIMQNNRWSIGVSMSWPLFTGYSHTNEISEAKANLEGTNAQTESRKLVVKEQVTQAYFQSLMSVETIKNAETALRQATENLEVARGRYKAGVTDLIELSDAQVLYSESQSSLVQSVYDRLKSLAQLEFAVGGNLPY